jgi:hypothetical protein
MIGELMMTNKELVPKCLNTEEAICLNAAGYFTPCCWFDAEDARKEDPLIEGFFDPSLNIDNHDDPTAIVEGEYWNKFIIILKTEPQCAPKRCWRQCSSGVITNKYLKNSEVIIRIKI